jgi:hypothetical protein
MFYHHGDGIVVAVRGPGKIHLLSYGARNIPAHVGSITTTSQGITRFMISHSYTFTGFAFYWDGRGKAVCGVGQNLPLHPVGKSWAAATTADWGANQFGTKNVASITTSAVNRDERVTCFIIPSLIPDI